MDTKKIKAILLAVEKSSMAQAAAEFSYTPSALSHMADSFEKELGVKLLSRTPSGVTLTEDGEFLRDKMQAVIEAEQALLSAAKKRSANSDCELRIGTYASISSTILPEILKDFKDKYPEIRVSIAVRNKLSDYLEKENGDVIFGDEIALRKSKAALTIDDPYVAVVHKDLFAGKRSVSREDLYDYPFIFTNHSIFNKYFEIDRFRELIHFDSVDDLSVVSMVEKGIGVAVLPNLVVRNARKTVRILALEPKISRQLGFAYNAHENGAPKSQATQKFIDFLKTVQLFKSSVE